MGQFYSVNFASFNQLSNLGKRLLSAREKSFMLKTQFFRPYCIAYLDQLSRNVMETREFDFYSSYPQLNQYLHQSGYEFLSDRAHFSNPFPQDGILGLQRFCGQTADVEPKVVEWVSGKVMPYIPPCSKELYKELVENFWEIVQNGLEHGQGNYGVSVCGQFYPAMGYLEVAFHDAGYSIPGRVRDYLGNGHHYADDQCIEWAVKKGSTTDKSGASRGLGLYFLREFLKLNGGIFQIASGNGYYAFSGFHDPVTNSLKNRIVGTLVNIRVVYDSNRYLLASEKEQTIS